MGREEFACFLFWIVLVILGFVCYSGDWFSVENLLEFWVLYDGFFLICKFDGILIG